MRYPIGILAALILIAPALATAAPKAKTKRGDVIWTHPDFATFPVTSIAFLPVASFDNSLKSEKTVEAQLGQALKASGHRWISPMIAKEMLRASFGEGALTALDQEILKGGRADSLGVARICRALRATAVMTARVDLFEQIQVEWNQSGKPSTTVQVRAALVDSTGRLLWTAAGSETAEGPYHDPGAATMAVKGSGLNTEPVTGQGGAPSFEEVGTRLFARWAQHFPPFPAAAPASPAPASPSPEKP
jgi:hypothetical protein